MKELEDKIAKLESIVCSLWDLVLNHTKEIERLRRDLDWIDRDKKLAENLKKLKKEQEKKWI